MQNMIDCCVLNILKLYWHFTLLNYRLVHHHKIHKIREDTDHQFSMFRLLQSTLSVFALYEIHISALFKSFYWVTCLK